MVGRNLSFVFCLLMLFNQAYPAFSAPQSPNAAAAAEKKTKQKLRRADFQVAGASCVSCLRRVSKILRTQRGVLKADVSIFKPHWSIVIYNADEVSLEQLSDACKVEKVRFEEIEDKPIAEVPLIVIPKGISKTDPGGH